MIVYLAKKHEFLDDVDSNKIEERIHAEFRRTHNHSVGCFREAVMEEFPGVMPANSFRRGNPRMIRVAIELGVPLSAKRIDFVLTGTSCRESADGDHHRA